MSRYWRRLLTTSCLIRSLSILLRLLLISRVSSPLNFLLIWCLLLQLCSAWLTLLLCIWPLLMLLRLILALTSYLLRFGWLSLRLLICSCLFFMLIRMLNVLDLRSWCLWGRLSMVIMTTLLQILLFYRFCSRNLSLLLRHVLNQSLLSQVTLGLLLLLVIGYHMLFLMYFWIL